MTKKEMIDMHSAYADVAIDVLNDSMIGKMPGAHTAMLTGVAVSAFPYKGIDCEIYTEEGTGTEIIAISAAIMARMFAELSDVPVTWDSMKVAWGMHFIAQMALEGVSREKMEEIARVFFREMPGDFDGFLTGCAEAGKDE